MVVGDFDCSSYERCPGRTPAGQIFHLILAIPREVLHVPVDLHHGRRVVCARSRECSHRDDLLAVMVLSVSVHMKLVLMRDERGQYLLAGDTI